MPTMFIDDQLTAEDMARAPLGSAAPEEIAAAYRFVLEAWEVFGEEAVVPVCLKLHSPSEREHAFVGLFYRAVGFCKSAVVLKTPAHYQSIVAAERSAIEICIDMQLLHRDVIPQGVERFAAFILGQKLKSARRVKRFFDKRFDLDPEGRKSEAQRAFISDHGDLIDAQIATLFPNRQGRPTMPDHWSVRTLSERAAFIGDSMELLVLQGYDMRNFAVHTGLAGLVGLTNAGFAMLFALGLGTIAQCLQTILTITEAELRLAEHIPSFPDVLSRLEELHALALADHRLQQLGEPSRLAVHRGHDWSQL